MKPAQILTQKLYKSDALTYGPHHHKQNRDQILDQTTHSMQTIYTNRRVDWINQWNNARGRERLDTVVIIINLVKQTRGWRKIQVKANTQNIRTRGKQKTRANNRNFTYVFPWPVFPSFLKFDLFVIIWDHEKKEYQGHHVSVGMFLHLFVVLLEFSHEFQHLNCQYWHSEFMFLLFLIWYHSVLAWRVATNTFRCFLYRSLFMFKTGAVIHSAPSNARALTLPNIKEKPNRQMQCRLGKPSIQSFVHGAPMDEVTGFGFGS